MKTTHITLVFFIVSLFAFAEYGFKTITWQDLIPVTKEIADPFAELDEKSLAELRSLVVLRRAIEQGEPHQEDITKEQELTASLKKKGINPDELLEQRLLIIKERQKASVATVQNLNTIDVEISGFMLPLEINNNQTDEFLLVPWIGACIHTPPPHGNQIIYVKNSTPIKVEGLYDAIKVRGKLIIENNNKELFLKDGNGQINSCYTISPSSIEHLDLDLK